MLGKQLPRQRKELPVDLHGLHIRIPPREGAGKVPSTSRTTQHPWGAGEGRCCRLQLRCERSWREAVEKAVTAVWMASIGDRPGFGFQGLKEMNCGDCKEPGRLVTAPPGAARHAGSAGRGCPNGQRGGLKADALQQLVRVSGRLRSQTPLGATDEHLRVGMA